MTSPRPTPAREPMAPVRRRGAAPTPAPEAYDDAEVARGQADAVLGALGRMQLRLDVLAREQAEALDKILTTLDRLSARLAALESPAKGARRD